MPDNKPITPTLSQYESNFKKDPDSTKKDDCSDNERRSFYKPSLQAKKPTLAKTSSIPKPK